MAYGNDNYNNYEGYGSAEDEFLGQPSGGGSPNEFSWDEAEPEAPDFNRAFGQKTDDFTSWIDASRAWKEQSASAYDKRAMQMKQAYEKALMGVDDWRQKKSLREQYRDRTDLFRKQWRQQERSQLSSMKSEYNKQREIYRRKKREWEARRAKAKAAFERDQERKRMQEQKKAELMSRQMKRNKVLNQRRQEEARFRELYGG